MRGFLAITFCACLVLVATAEHARADASGFVLEVPKQVIADGATAISVVIRMPAGAAGEDVTDLEVSADAGQVGDTAEVSGSVIRYEYVPPRLVRQRRVGFSVRANYRDRSVRLRGVVLAKPVPLERGEGKSAGDYALAGPAQLYLGVDTSATIRFKSSGVAPTFLSNVGTLSAPQLDAQGRGSVSFQLPREQYPQLAMIVAVDAERARFDWLVIPLLGRGELDLRSEANAVVRVDVAGTAYGPVRTDLRGRANVDVFVPPGQTHAQTEAFDKLGNRKRGRLPLESPDYRRIVMACPATNTTALLFAIEPTGSPASRPPQITVAPGSFAPARRIADGVFRAQFTAPSDAAIGDSLTARAMYRGDQRSATCRAAIPGEVPTSARVILTPSVYRAGQGPVSLRVELGYAGKLPRLTVPFSLRPSLGRVQRLPAGSADGAGQWTIPPDFAGANEATIRVVLTDSAVSVGEARLALAAAAPARLEPLAAGLTVLADAVSQVQLRIRVTDQYGNPVNDATLSGRGLGVVGPFLPATRAGDYLATYTAPRLYSGTYDRVTVTVDQLQVAVPIKLRPSARPGAALVRFGYFTNLGQLHGPTAQLQADRELGVLRGRLRAGLATGVMVGSDQRFASDGSELVSIAVTTVPMLAQLIWEQPLGPLLGRVAAGAGGVYVNFNLESQSIGSSIESGFRFAAGTEGSLEARVGPGQVSLAVGYLYAGSGGEKVEGKPAGLFAAAGYRLGW